MCQSLGFSRVALGLLNFEALVLTWTSAGALKSNLSCVLPVFESPAPIFGTVVRPKVLGRRQCRGALSEVVPTRYA